MKLLAFIKFVAKGIMREAVTLLLIFSIFPMALGGILAYMQKGIFTPETTIPKIEMKIIDNDKTGLSMELIKFLSSDGLRDIVTIDNDKKDIKYELIIPYGYEKDILSFEKGDITVKVNDTGKKARGSADILCQIVDRYNEEVTYKLIVDKSITSVINEPAERERLGEFINSKLAEAHGSSMISGNIVKPDRNITSFEYYSVSFLGFMFIMLIMSLAGGIFTEMENGVFNRIISTSISKLRYFNYNLITNFIFALLMNMIYVAAYRLLGLSFNGSIFLLIIIVIVQSVLAAAVAGVLAAFLNKKTSNLFMQVILMIQVVAGGSFFPFEKIANSAFLKGIGNFSPDVLISKAYKNYILSGSFESVKSYLLGMLAVSMILYIMSAIKVKVKWGE